MIKRRIEGTAIIYIYDLDSTIPDQTIDLIARNPTYLKDYRAIIYISEMDEDKFNRIFFSDIFEKIHHIMFSNDEDVMWYIDECASIYKAKTKIEVRKVIEDYLMENENDGTELYNIILKLKTLIDISIETKSGLKFVF